MQGTGIAQQQMTMAGGLPVRKQQYALFTQCIPPISGEHMHQIVRIALAIAVPLDKVVIALTARLLRLFDEPGGSQAFAFHEIAIGVRYRTLGMAAQGGMVVENGRQERFARA